MLPNGRNVNTPNLPENEVDQKRSLASGLVEQNNFRKYPISRILAVFIIFILAIHYLASVFYWYDRFWWFDIPMHILGGAWVSILFFYLFCQKKKVFFKEVSPLIVIILALGFVALVSIFWEFYEYLGDIYRSNKYSIIIRPDINDTLADFLNDLVGGLVATVLILLNKKKFLSRADY